MLTFTQQINADREKVSKVQPIDSIGQEAKVDGGIKNIQMLTGGAIATLEAGDETGLLLVTKADNTVTEYPATSTFSFDLDVDLGEGVKTITITGNVVTVAAEAVGVNVADVIDRPRT